MNTKLPFIEKYIIKNFPIVDEVYFTKYKSYLGSSPELPEDQRSREVTRINIVINNSKDVLSKFNITDLTRKIRNDIDRYFNLELGMYGSQYDTEFYIIVKKTLTNYLSE
jgi:hypothetical protein